MAPLSYRPLLAPLRSYAVARRLFMDGTETPRSFLEQCLGTIEEREADVRAFVALDIPAARRAADAATHRYRAGRPLSSVDGCPVGIKDIINTADFPTQMNSPIYRGWQPSWDAACVYALRQGGAVIVGKTVTTEFACGDSGPTRNPFDLGRTPGGSSSGSAAAVGSGMLPAALGTQTRASTIRPASYCGAFGFKPSYGALNLQGVHPVAPSLDHLGVIAGSLDDCWSIASHISTMVGGAAGSPGLVGPATLPLPAPLRRIAWLKTAGWHEIDDLTRTEFEGFLSSLRGCGVDVLSADNNPKIADFDGSLDGADELAREITAFEMRSPMASYLDRYPDKLGNAIQQYLALSDRLTIDDYRQRLRRRGALRAALAELEGIDLFVTLASSGPAPLGLESTGSRSFISPWTLLGGPSLSLPLCVAAGLPVGIQIMAPPGEDARLVGFAAWIVDSVAR